VDGKITAVNTMESRLEMLGIQVHFSSLSSLTVTLSMYIVVVQCESKSSLPPKHFAIFSLVVNLFN